MCVCVCMCVCMCVCVYLPSQVSQLKSRVALKSARLRILKTCMIPSQHALKLLLRLRRASRAVDQIAYRSDCHNSVPFHYGSESLFAVPKTPTTVYSVPLRSCHDKRGFATATEAGEREQGSALTALLVLRLILASVTWL